MLKIHTYILLTYIIIIPSILCGQKTLNLQQCIDYAYKYNFDIKQIELRIKQTENSLWQSRQAIYPTINGSLSQGLNLGRSIDPFTNDFVQRTISSNVFGINGNMVIYNGSSLKNQVLQNEYNVLADEWDIKRAKNELRNRIVLAYMQVLMNQELWKSAQDQVENIQKQITQFKELIKEGTKAPANLIDLDAQLATAEFDIITTKNNIEVAKLSLAQLMSFSNYQKLEIESISINENNVLLTGDYLKNILVYTQSQPIIKVFELRNLSSKLGVKIAEASKSPSISLIVGLSSIYSSAASNEFNYFKQLYFNLNQNARIGMSIPIFTAGQMKSRITNSIISQKIVEMQFEQSKIQIRHEIEHAYLTAKVSQEKLLSAIRQLTTQKSAFDSANDRYKEGIINLIDMNTFRLNLERAKLNLIQSKYEFYFRKLILDFYEK